MFIIKFFIRFFWVIFMASVVDGAYHHKHREQEGSEECPEFKVLEDFNPSRFMGTWHEIFAYPYPITLGSRCVQSTYALTHEGNITIYSKFVDRRGMENKMIGMAYEKYPGILSMSISAFCKIILNYSEPSIVCLV